MLKSVPVSCRVAENRLVLEVCRHQVTLQEEHGGNCEEKDHDGVEAVGEWNEVPGQEAMTRRTHRPWDGARTCCCASPIEHGFIADQ